VFPFDSLPLLESDSDKPEVEAFEAISFKLLAPTSVEVEGCETHETPEISLEGWSNQEPLSLVASSSCFDRNVRLSLFYLAWVPS